MVDKQTFEEVKPLFENATHEQLQMLAFMAWLDLRRLECRVMELEAELKTRERMGL